MSVAIFAWVTGASSPSPHDQIMIEGMAQADGASSAFSWSCYQAFSDSQDDTNTNIAAAVSAAAVTAGYTVASITVVSGAAPSVAGFASTSYVDSAIAGRAAASGSGSPVTLALNTARQPSASRPTRVTVSGTWTASVTASGTVALKSDANSPPTTVVADQQPAVTLAIGVGVTMPWSLTYDVPAAHYYQIATSGTGTFAITHINETTL